MILTDGRPVSSSNYHSIDTLATSVPVSFVESLTDNPGGRIQRTGSPLTFEVVRRIIRACDKRWETECECMPERRVYS